MRRVIRFAHWDAQKRCFFAPLTQTLEKNMNEDEYIKWRNLIGEFMLVFAKVENTLNDLIVDLSSNEEYDEIVKNQFKRRVIKAKSLVQEKVTDTILLGQVNTLLDQLLNIAENERNLIAHNPLELSLESIFEDLTYLEIRSQRKSDKYISYEKLSQKI